ncbi:MAG: hypothetical protein Q7U14_05040 [Lacisediminimonas sp.]|nr:hypothetical protein [Lacisediminimonas sp.]
MSIAASVLISPSRLLQRLVALLGIAIAVIGCRFALVGFLAPASRTFPTSSTTPSLHVEYGTPASSLELVLATLLLLLGLGLIYCSSRTRKSFQLDISGVGEIRLREHDTRAVADSAKSSRNRRSDGETVQLMDDSTIWPNLLALRLRRPDGSRIGLIVLPDMVAPDSFRALVVAVQWIAARDSTNGT